MAVRIHRRKPDDPGKERRLGMVVAVVVLALLSILPLYQAYGIWSVHQVETRGVTTEGYVVDIGPAWGRGNRMENVTFEYDVAGRTYTATRKEYEGLAKLGGTVQVRYLPERPEQVVLGEQRTSYWGLFFWVVIWGGLAFRMLLRWSDDRHEQRPAGM